MSSLLSPALTAQAYQLDSSAIRNRPSGAENRESIGKLAECVEGLLEVIKSVEEELWLPFALRGMIYENVTELCALADQNSLSRARAAEIVGRLNEGCLFYEGLLERSATLRKIRELAWRIR